MFSTKDDATSMQVEGPGLRTPAVCRGKCTLTLSEGTYSVRIDASGRTWFVPVPVSESRRVVVDAPNSAARGLGIALVLIGGSTLSVAGFVAYVGLVTCTEGSVQCDDLAVPYWLAATGAGALVGAIGIGLIVSNNKPQVDILPAMGSRARREPGTFIGLGPVQGATGPGLSLRASF